MVEFGFYEKIQAYRKCNIERNYDRICGPVTKSPYGEIGIWDTAHTTQGTETETPLGQKRLKNFRVLKDVIGINLLVTQKST